MSTESPPDMAARGRDAIRRMAKPRVVAIVGASPRPDGYGGRLFAAAVRSEPGLTVYPVNPNYEEVDGRKSYPTVSSLPEVPDVVGVVVRRELVLSVLRDSQEAGVPAAVVVSAGFAERGEGDDGQNEIRRLAEEGGIRVCGPNCLGIANVADDLWLCASGLSSDLPSAPRTGGVGLICQSGALGFVTLVPRAAEMGVDLSCVFTTGNEADLEFSDFAQYLAEDPSTDVIAGFVEGFRNIPNFIAASRVAAARRKPIVVIKIGRAAAGTSAARSHTAALTGADEVTEALFKQCGVIRVADYEELLAVANLLAVWKPSEPTLGVGVMSNSGGVGSLTADLLGDAGLSLPPLSDSARHQITEILGGFGWASNPADITQVAWRDEFRLVLRAMLEEAQIGAVVVASTPSKRQAELLCAEAARSRKQVIYLWTGSWPGAQKDPDRYEALRLLREAGIPVFVSPAQLAKAVNAVKEYYEWAMCHLAESPYDDQAAPLPPLKPRLQQLQLDGQTNLSEWESAELLRSAGIAFAAGGLSRDEDEAIRIAEDLGYPVVVKVNSPDVPHKTDLGLVQINLVGSGEVRAAFKAVRERAYAHSDAVGNCKILVQRYMSDGVEFVVGTYRDPQAGPVIVCGAGGQFVELYDDVSRRLCPVSPSTAAEMLDELRIAPVFRGFRGKAPVDRHGLVQMLVRLSEIAVAAEDSISEIELNPVIVSAGAGSVVAVDALVTLNHEAK